MNSPLVLDELSIEARTLYQAFDVVLDDAWRPLESYSAHVAPVARWLPQDSWRTLWQELGSHCLVAHQTRLGADYISRWNNRFVEDRILLDLPIRMAVARHYSDWQEHNWDTWSDFLSQQDVQSEALWQLNHALCLMFKYDILESRDSGKYLRGTNNNLSWIYKVTSTR
jgi:hypothetical protein